MNANYRVWFPMQALAARGHHVQVHERNVVDDDSGLVQCDVVVFCRSFYRPMESLARRLRAAGIGIVWDNDDDLTALPKGVRGYEQVAGLRGQRVANAMTAMMRLADIVTAPSAVLAQRYREMGGTEAWVLENYLPPAFFGMKNERRDDDVLVGWHAGVEHQFDVEQLGLRAAFERLLAEHPRVRVVSIGLRLPLAHERYEHQPWADYEALPWRIAQFDVGLAPVADAQFNRARSNIKVKEYAGAGVPWLASPIDPYAGLGEHQGGRLVSSDRWYEEIERLVLDAKARKKLAKKGRRWAKGETIERNVERWERVLVEVSERAGVEQTF